MKKSNTVKHSSSGSLLVFISVVLVSIGAVAIAIGYDRLRSVYNEQSIVADYDNQITIASGKMVKADVIADIFGIKPGANLATIDFGEKRKAALEKVPNLRDIRIIRKLPDRVTITIEEREPIARLGVKNGKGDTGKVVDAESVVFYCARGTQLLPIIREAKTPGSAAGSKLEPRARAALRLVEACRESEFQELGLLEVDTSPVDYLLATINTGSSYARLKIAWEDMDESATPASRTSLNRQLQHLRDAIRTRIGDGAVIWNATDYSSPGRIYADTKGKL